MLVKLFGGVRAYDDDGAALDVGPAKCQAVLATLALATGHAVPVPRLVDVVWGEEPPRTAEKTLQGYIVRLRRVLGAHVIARVGDAYRLEVAADAVDVCRFRTHLARGEVEAALAEWTGDPLAGLGAGTFGAAVDGLTEQRACQVVCVSDSGHRWGLTRSG